MNFPLSVLVTLSLALNTTDAFAQAPDTILFNGKIVTADEGGTVHQALALRNIGACNARLRTERHRA